MKTTIVYVKAKFKGVYEWGGGFKDAEAVRKWDAYWQKLSLTRSAIFWQYCTPKDSYSCGFLVGIAGSFYVHPMDFNGTLKMPSSGLLSELRELERICKDAAEAVGGTCEIHVSEPQEVSFEDTFPLHKVYPS